jgi:uncharacterized protein YjiS (DUF1127 family)
MLRILSDAPRTLESHCDGLVWRPSWRSSALTRLGCSAVRLVWFWMERSRQRRALAELDDRLLRDVGLTRDDARRECANPFWKA